MDRFQVADGHKCVNLCGFQGLMSQHLLEMANRRAVLEHVRGAGVAKSVRGYVLFDTGKLGAGLHHAPDPAAVHPTAPAVKDQVAGVLAADKRWSNGENIAFRQIAYPAAQGNHAVFAALAVDLDKA